MKNFIFGFIHLSFIYLEILFKYLNSLDILDVSTFFVCIFSIILSSFLCVILYFVSNKTKVVIFGVLLFILGAYFTLHTCLFSMYKFYFSFSSLKMANQVAAFAGDGLNVLKNNWYVAFYFVPFILLIIFRKKLIKDLEKVKLNVIILIVCLIVYLPFALDPYGYVNKTFSKNNMIQVVNKNGVLPGLFFDIYKTINNESTLIEVVEENVQDDSQTEDVEYGYNAFDIDYKSLNDKTNKQEIVTINNYIADKKPTRQNEYTSFFEGKNLILFMAESFNGICVNPELTPTLYKLVNSGFSFSNFYTPTIYSTIGGEFCELTGLFPDLSGSPNSLYIFRSNDNTYPMGIGSLFKDKGYATYAYHDSTYSFQDRNVYLHNLGFNNYNACGIGLEKEIECGHWPASDVEMIEATFDDYINEDKFLTFYATVSGHGPYVFDSKNNNIAPKYRDAIKDYFKDSLGTGTAADMLMAYQAGQMELDRALETLINKLESSGKMEDTVIALVGDHHPYYITDSLSMDEYNRLSTYERDKYIELYHSNFILYNSEMETVKIDKVGSQLDVIPTLYNLFGMDYDSRLLLGVDLLSTSSSIAIMPDNSWVNDRGKYYALSSKFEPTQDIGLSDSYVEMINNKVSNMQQISRMIMRNNYYQFVYDNK